MISLQSIDELRPGSESVLVSADKLRLLVDSPGLKEVEM